MASDARTRWHDQTRMGGPDAAREDRGDCLPACITSILGLPLDAIGNHHCDGWYLRYEADLRALGFAIVEADLCFEPPLCLWVAVLPSLNLFNEDGSPMMHCVVARGGDLVHDPCLGRRYSQGEFAVELAAGRVESCWVFAPLDPSGCGPHGG